MLLFFLHTLGRSQCHTLFAGFTAPTLSHVCAVDVWMNLFVVYALHSHPAYPLWLHRNVPLRVFTMILCYFAVQSIYSRTDFPTAAPLQLICLWALYGACVFGDVVFFTLLLFCVDLWSPPTITCSSRLCTFFCYPRIYSAHAHIVSSLPLAMHHIHC